MSRSSMLTVIFSVRWSFCPLGPSVVQNLTTVTAVVWTGRKSRKGQDRGLHWRLLLPQSLPEWLLGPRPHVHHCLPGKLTCIRLVTSSPMVPCLEDIFHLSPQTRRSVLDPAVDWERHRWPFGRRLLNDTLFRGVEGGVIMRGSDDTGLYNLKGHGG